MRIKVVQTPPPQTIDGIDLKRFIAGGTYDVGLAVSALLFAEGWAIPIDNEATDEAPDDRHGADPPNLVREIFPSYENAPSTLAFDSRKFPKKR